MAPKKGRRSTRLKEKQTVTDGNITDGIRVLQADPSKPFVPCNDDDMAGLRTKGRLLASFFDTPIDQGGFGKPQSQFEEYESLAKHWSLTSETLKTSIDRVLQNIGLPSTADPKNC
jgi:hypothetical protein